MHDHTVLFVDDEPNILKAVQRLLRHEPINVLCASRGQEALDLLCQQPAQVVVSDQRMPEMSGVDLLSAVRERHGDTVRVMMTGYTDMHIAVDAINRGAIYRLITKPWNDEELKATLRSAFDHFDLKREIGLNRVTREQYFKLQDTNRTLGEKVRERTSNRRETSGTANSLCADDSRAGRSGGRRDSLHAWSFQRVGVYASKIARELGGFPKEFIERVYIAGLLHDVGKIGVRDLVIGKPAPLSADEYEEMKRHPEVGARILEPVSFLSDVVPCVRHHHEWFGGSGSGYPDRLCGDQIPLPSRIILVADTVEAMTSDRPYRKGLPLQLVVAELNRFSGTQFDPAIVRPCLALLEREGSRSSEGSEVRHLCIPGSVEAPQSRGRSGPGAWLLGRTTNSSRAASSDGRDMLGACAEFRERLSADDARATLQQIGFVGLRDALRVVRAGFRGSHATPRRRHRRCRSARRSASQTPARRCAAASRVHSRHVPAHGSSDRATPLRVISARDTPRAGSRACSTKTST